MRLTRRTLGFAALAGTALAGAALASTGGAGRLLGGSFIIRLLAGGQDQAPNRREFTITAKDYRFSPNRLEVTQDDLVKLTVKSADVAYSLTIDVYRVSRRIPAGGSTTLEFRANHPGTFAFYSDLTVDTRHAQMRGELVVTASR